MNKIHVAKDDWILTRQAEQCILVGWFGPPGPQTRNSEPTRFGLSALYKSGLSIFIAHASHVSLAGLPNIQFKKDKEGGLRYFLRSEGNNKNNFLPFLCVPREKI